MAHLESDGEVQQVFPYLRVRNAEAAIDFYQRAFGAQELNRLAEPGGRIGHAELKLGPGIIMLAEEHPEHGILSPLAFGGTGSSLHLHVADVDAMTQRAVDCGAKLLMPPKTQFYGERTSKLVDPFGHEWLLGQHMEDVSFEEMQRRYTKMMNEH